MSRRIELDHHGTVFVGEKDISRRAAAKSFGVEAVIAIGAMRIEGRRNSDQRFAIRRGEERRADEARGRLAAFVVRQLSSIACQRQ